MGPCADIEGPQPLLLSLINCSNPNWWPCQSIPHPRMLANKVYHCQFQWFGANDSSGGAGHVALFHLGTYTCKYAQLLGQMVLAMPCLSWWLLGIWYLFLFCPMGLRYGGMWWHRRSTATLVSLMNHSSHYGWPCQPIHQTRIAINNYNWQWFSVQMIHQVVLGMWPCFILATKEMITDLLQPSIAASKSDLVPGHLIRRNQKTGLKNWRWYTGTAGRPGLRNSVAWTSINCHQGRSKPLVSLMKM